MKIKIREKEIKNDLTNVAGFMVDDFMSNETKKEVISILERFGVKEYIFEPFSLNNKSYLSIIYSYNAAERSIFLIEELQDGIYDEISEKLKHEDKYILDIEDNTDGEFFALTFGKLHVPGVRVSVEHLIVPCIKIDVEKAGTFSMGLTKDKQENRLTITKEV